MIIVTRRDYENMSDVEYDHSHSKRLSSDENMIIVTRRDYGVT